MSYAIRLVALANGRPLPEGAAGGWVKSYNPSANAGRGDLVVTHEPTEAQRFPSQAAAWALWNATAKPPHHRRADGMPNRPLTAWTIAVERLP
jgi:hypothetical protein